MRKIYSLIAAMILTATTWAQVMPNTVTVCGSIANSSSSTNTVTMMYQSYTYNSVDTLVVTNNQFCFYNLPIFADTNNVQYYSIVIWANNCQPVVLNGNFNPNSPYLTVTLPTCTSTCSASIATSTIPGTTMYSLNASGTGTAPFTYAWNTGATTQSIASIANQVVYSVVITDATGCTATANYVDSNAVSTPCSVILSAPNAANGNIVATSTGGAAPYTYVWSYNGVTVANVMNTNTLAPMGNGTYCVNSYDANGCFSTACINYTGSNPSTSCSASFYSFPDSMATPGTPSYGLINFVSNASGVAPFTYNWSFSDGTTSNQAYPSHAFTSPNGNNWACVVITDATGCSSNYCSPVYVPSFSSQCVAMFSSYSTYNPSAPGELSFQNLSNVVAPATYSWSFGDGSSSSAMNPNHTYSASGTYYVCLTVSANGCTSSFCQSTYVDLNWWGSNPISSNGCSAGFVVLPGNAATGVITIVDISQASNGANYNWTISNGGSSSNNNPFFNLGGVGSYVLCLGIVDSTTACYSYFCDTLTVDSAGNVFKSLSNFNGNASINVVSAPKKLTSTGIQQLVNTNTISVMPNPATDVVRITFNENKNTSIQVIDLNGKVVKSNTVNSVNQTELNVSDLAEGLYIVKVTNNNGVATTKLNVVK